MNHIIPVEQIPAHLRKSLKRSAIRKAVREVMLQNKVNLMKQVPRHIFGQLAGIILEHGAKKATKVLSPALTVKATRIGKTDRRSRITKLRLTVGKPNYAERKFIKACQKAGESFPVKKIQLKHDTKVVDVR